MARKRVTFSFGRYMWDFFFLCIVYSLSHVRIIKRCTFLLTLKTLDKQRLESLRINLRVLSVVSQKNVLTLSVILNQFRIVWKQWSVINCWITQLRYSCKREPFSNDLLNVCTLLRRERVFTLRAAITARPASLAKLIDRLYLSLEYGVSLLVSCKLPFPVVGFKISSLRNFTLICPNRIHDEHMHLQLLFKNSC